MTNSTINKHNIVIQIATKQEHPDTAKLKNWALHALQSIDNPYELTIRLVDSAEMQHLNKNYRQQDKPTNVLSFPFQASDITCDSILGDIALCAEVINMEARQQAKTTQAHWAHMVIHGILHLLGYDHIKPDDAEVMEQQEILLLQQIQFTNPYG